MKTHLEMVCVSDLEREGSTDQRVSLKSPVTSRASLCIFSLEKPFCTEGIAETTMAVSIKNKKNVGADEFSIAYCMLRTAKAKSSERKQFTPGVRNAYSCAQNCALRYLPLSGADCAKCCVIKLCVLQRCQVYGFDLHVDEQRMEGGYCPGKQFKCEVVCGTMSSQCLKGHKHP